MKRPYIKNIYGSGPVQVQTESRIWKQIVGFWIIKRDLIWDLLFCLRVYKCSWESRGKLVDHKQVNGSTRDEQVSLLHDYYYEGFLSSAKHTTELKLIYQL